MRMLYLLSACEQSAELLSRPDLHRPALWAQPGGVLVNGSQQAPHKHVSPCLWYVQSSTLYVLPPWPVHQPGPLDTELRKALHTGSRQPLSYQASLWPWGSKATPEGHPASAKPSQERSFGKKSFENRRRRMGPEGERGQAAASCRGG